MVKQEMARENVDILGISELKWTGVGESNSDDHYLLLWAVYNVVYEYNVVFIFPLGAALILALPLLFLKTPQTETKL